MLYFAVWHLEADGGIQITGSHNPPDFNGFKMMMGKKSFFGADIQKLGEIAAKGDFETGAGQASRRSTVLADYAARLLKDVKPGRKLKVAWDTGNGAVGVSIRAVVDKLPGDALHPEREGRRHLPRAPSRSDGAGEPQAAAGRGEEGTAATSASPSTATATASARSTARAASCGATSS